RPHRHESKGFSELLGGLAYLKRDRRVAALYVLMSFFGIVGMGYAALVPAYARLVVHTQATGYSLLLAGSGLGATVGALLVASLGGLKRKVMLVGGGMALFGAALSAAGVLPGVVSRLWPHPAGLQCGSGCLF